MSLAQIHQDRENNLELLLTYLCGDLTHLLDLPVEDRPLLPRLLPLPRLPPLLLLQVLVELNHLLPPHRPLVVDLQHQAVPSELLNAILLQNRVDLNTNAVLLVPHATHSQIVVFAVVLLLSVASTRLMVLRSLIVVIHVT
jgi:hypothetical protein